MNELEELINGLDYHDAVRAMHQGNIVQYIGTVIGDLFIKNGSKFCMLRGVIFEYVDGSPVAKTHGNMLYCTGFRYKLTGETIDPRNWVI